MDPSSRQPAPQERLQELFPAGIACSWLEAMPTAWSLLPEEAAAATGFVPARLAEFRLGRACARHALNVLGVPPTGIGMGSHREPLWPAGIVGSISHAGGLAAAAAARTSNFAALGLDIETTTALDPMLMATVCRPEEASRLRISDTAGADGMLVFSAKEAAYKALWPVVRRFMDFQDLAIVFDLPRYRFQVITHTTSCPAALARHLHGRFHRSGELIVTAAWIEAADARLASAAL